MWLLLMFGRTGAGNIKLYLRFGLSQIFRHFVPTKLSLSLSVSLPACPAHCSRTRSVTSELHARRYCPSSQQDKAISGCRETSAHATSGLHSSSLFPRQPAATNLPLRRNLASKLYIDSVQRPLTGRDVTGLGDTTATVQLLSFGIRNIGG